MSKKSKKRKIATAQANIPTAPLPKKEELAAGKGFLRRHKLPLLIIGFLTFILYVQTVNYDYVLDDILVIQDNKFTQEGIKGIGDIFGHESFQGYFGEQKELVEGSRYRPLSIATFALEQSIFGDRKDIRHLINVILYVLSVLLLYRILCFLFPPGEEKNRKSPLYFSVPFIATLLFAIHPLHTEVVANIKGRDDIIALLGELATLYFTFQYLQFKKTKYLIYSFFAFLLGIFSKEGVITFLAVVPLTAHFFTSAEFSDKLKVTLPAIAGTIIYLAIRINVIGYLFSGQEITDIMNNPFYGMSVADKYATIFYTLLLYLKLLIFPYPLTHDYYPYQIPEMNWAQWQPILSLILYAALAMIVLKGWKKKTVWAYAAAYYLITLSIVSNLFVSIGTFMNERFLYHASLGFCIAMAYIIARKIYNNPKWKSAAVALAVLLLAGFSARTLWRIPDWKNKLTLNSAAIKYSPNSARANCFYGVAIWDEVYKKLPSNASNEQRKAVLDSMQPYFNKSVEIYPAYGSAQKMMAGMAAEYHKIDGNLPKLINAFDKVNRSGAYVRFVQEYLEYLTRTVQYKKDAEELSAFYLSMIDFYKIRFPNSSLPAEYKKMYDTLQARMSSLN